MYILPTVILFSDAKYCGKMDEVCFENFIFCYALDLLQYYVSKHILLFLQEKCKKMISISKDLHQLLTTVAGNVHVS